MSAADTTPRCWVHAGKVAVAQLPDTREWVCAECLVESEQPGYRNERIVKPTDPEYVERKLRMRGTPNLRVWRQAGLWRVTWWNSEGLERYTFCESLRWALYAMAVYRGWLRREP